MFGKGKQVALRLKWDNRNRRRRGKEKAKISGERESREIKKKVDWTSKRKRSGGRASQKEGN
jgi:hypothetical protein